MKKVKLAVIGLGNMGAPHTRDIQLIPNAELAAVCDIIPERAEQIAALYSIPAYTDYRDLIDNADIDGVIVATPHYDHTPISIYAMQHGKNVLCEKPLAVHVKDAQKMISSFEAEKTKNPNLVFAAMFQMRTSGYWQKVKNLIESGELGQLVRTTWIITEWFRTQTYYDLGGWRATWKGEGGGVLLNQCPHNLDLYQWLVGLPERVWGFAHIGKYHNIEVEDEVTGYFEHKNGMVGHFITTTAEAPGTNRLEVVGENGKLVCDKGKITFNRNRCSMLEDIKISKAAFAKVEDWEINIPFSPDSGHPHRDILQNYVNAIQNQEPLIAPAPEGIRSVSLGNAIMLSSFTGKPAALPLDGDEYEKHLLELINTSSFKKSAGNTTVTDISQSFSK